MKAQKKNKSINHKMQNIRKLVFGILQKGLEHEKSTADRPTLRAHTHTHVLLLRMKNMPNNIHNSTSVFYQVATHRDVPQLLWADV